MKRVLITLIISFFIASSFNLNVHATEEKPENLLSESAIVIDAISGQILYGKNHQKKMYPASLTKIATAIYAIENSDLSDIVTVSANAREAEGTRVYLVEGEQVTLEKLIQGLLINSGNDAGIAIAEHMHGTVSNFSKNLNEYLKNKIGIESTHFENPHGLFNSKHVTTAEDLAKIAQYAMKNDIFKEIIGTKELQWHGEDWTTTLYHHHKLLRENPYEGVSGGKTGYVDESGHTLLTTADRKNISLIIVVLNGDHPMDTYKDTVQLLDYAFSNFQTETISKGKEFKNEFGEIYRTTDPLFYTRSIRDDDVITELSKDGILSIKQKDFLLHASFQLEKEVEKATLIPSGKEGKQESAEKSSSRFSLIYLVPFGIVVFIILFRWRKRKSV